MRAIRIDAPGGPEVLVPAEIPTPEPGSGELLIRVAAAGVNYADLGLRAGGFHGPGAGGYPLTPGFEVVGTVAALGANVADFSVGQRVGAVLEAGGYAEYAVAEAGRTMPLPDEIGDVAAAALLIQGPTAYGVLHDAGRLRVGEGVLVQAAAGGVGSLAVQLARLAGARPVVATAGSAPKRELATELGADAAIDYGREDWPDAVRAATDGRGVDLILETVGGAVGARALGCLAPLGRLVFFGGASGQGAHFPDLWPLAFGGQSLIGFGGPWLRPGRAAVAREALVRHLLAGELRVVEGPSFALAEAAAAHRAIAARQTVGKGTLRVALGA